MATEAPSSAPGTSLARARADSILAYSEADGVLGRQADVFLAHLREKLPDVPEARWARVVPVIQDEFQPAKLHRDLVGYLVREAPEGRIAEVLHLLRTGATARMDSLTAGFAPEMTFEEYLLSIQDDPPPQERVRLMTRLASAQSAGDFYVVVNEAIRASAHLVARRLQPGIADFVGIQDDEYLELRRRWLQISAVSFLHRFEGVPDALVQEAVEEYQTEAGRWYAESYTMGVAEAVQEAGDRVVKALGARS
jgi:hypothetical protein